MARGGRSRAKRIVGLRVAAAGLLAAAALLFGAAPAEAAMTLHLGADQPGRLGVSAATSLLGLDLKMDGWLTGSFDVAGTIEVLAASAQALCMTYRLWPSLEAGIRINPQLELTVGGKNLASARWTF